MATSTAFTNSRVARGVAIKTIFKDLRAGNVAFLPQRIAIFGQGSTLSTYSTVKAQITSAYEAGTTYGFGSPIHLAALQMFPINGDGVGSIPVTVYPLDDDGTGVVSDGDITPSGTITAAAQYTVEVNNIVSEPFVISVADTVAAIVTAMTTAINAVLDMPIIAVDGTTKVTFTSKWKGVSANDIYVEVVGSTTVGNVFTITQANGGLVNPDVDAALAQMGDIWETLVLNCMELSDTATLGKFSVVGEGRWGAEVRRPFAVLTGETEATVATATAGAEARKTDRVNGQVSVPGSNDLPLQVAARAIARIALRADNDPAYDFGSMPLTGITPGTDAEQWTSTQRDYAIKRGASSVKVKDGVVNLADTVTFYHPTGEVVPAYRYVVDIIKIMTILYNLDLIFDSVEWDGKPLVPDNQVITNPNAKKPRMAVGDIWLLIESLAQNAIISDAAFAKDNTFASIDTQNPKRLNINSTMKISGNSNVISVDFNFGFYFGTATII